MEEPTEGSSAKRGTVQQVLPNAMFEVALDEGSTVRASMATQLRHVIVRLIAGDRVEVRLATNDPHRGRIIKKL